jgi:hypothetical protein
MFWRYIYRLLVFIYSFSLTTVSIAAWNSLAWQYPNSNRWPSGGESPYILPTMDVMQRTFFITVTAPKEYGFEEWDGGVDTEFDYGSFIITARVAAIDFPIPVPPTNEVTESGGSLVWTQGWTAVRAAVADWSDDNFTNWNASYTFTYEQEVEWVDGFGVTNQGQIVWEIEEEYEHQTRDDLRAPTPENARVFDLYGAIQERWIAASLTSTNSGVERHVIKNPNTNAFPTAQPELRGQIELDFNWKPHYGRNIRREYLPTADGIDDSEFWEDFDRWPQSLSNRYLIGFSGFSFLDSAWALLGAGIRYNNHLRVRAALESLLPSFINTSLMSDSNFEEWFDTFDTNAIYSTSFPDAPYLWQHYNTDWDFVDGVFEPAGFRARWLPERYPEDVPNWTLETFFMAYTNIPHYWEPTSVSTAVLSGVTVTNFAQRTDVFGSKDPLILQEVVWEPPTKNFRGGTSGTQSTAWGWHTGELDQRYATPGAEVTNYTLKATWFDWAPERTRLYYDYPEFGTTMTTRWQVASHEGFFLNSQTNWVPVLSTNVLVDSFGRTNQWRYTRGLNIDGENKVSSVDIALYRCLSNNCANLELFWSENFEEPTEVTLEGVYTQDIIAPGFRAADYGIHHATNVVAAMTHTRKLFVFPSAVEIERKSGFELDSYNLQYFFVKGSGVTTSNESQTVTNTIGTVVENLTTLIADENQGEFAQQGIAFFESYRETDEESASYSSSDSPTVFSESIDEVETKIVNERGVTSSVLLSQQTPITGPSATASLYLVYPRRSTQDVLQVSVSKSACTNTLSYSNGQRRLYDTFTGVTTGFGRVKETQMVDPGDRYSSTAVLTSLGSGYSAPPLTVSASGSYSGTCGDTSLFSSDSEEETIVDSRYVITKPLLIFEWGFEYK